MTPLSAVIITYNEEEKIRRCLQSLRALADEIVVVDSFSTDKTKAICEEFGVRFIEQAFLGYIEQKNYAIDQACHDHIISLDADEALDERLIESIRSAKEKDFPSDGYVMNRCTNYCGKWIRHGSWYPDRKLRLFDRKKARWGGINPHDRIVMQPSTSLHRLPGDILHYTYSSLEEQVAQLNRFTSIQAKALYEQGKRASLVKLLVNPAVAFFSGYVLKGGFLDGWDGLIIARSVSYQTFVKYAKLLEWQRRAKGPR